MEFLVLLNTLILILAGSLLTYRINQKRHRKQK